ncbi:hypothetical protein [Nocardioides albus]|uniref:Uncharacterized protein n=1 Tax=Nocardioides albus TaxID=1841 RepID=A0A7W5A953_9ACTN|nr:hypothetical protein [Nocardioides albus]MBB3091997.1 hypothetical protein [Nocardioides albus]
MKHYRPALSQTAAVRPSTLSAVLTWKRLAAGAVSFAVLVCTAAVTSAAVAVVPLSSATAALSGTAMTGSVLANNEPVVGADIVVVAWPNQATLEMLGDEQKVETHVIATTKSDVSGKFDIQVDPGILPKELVSDVGQVDVDVIVADKDHEAERSLSLLTTADGWTSAEVVASAAVGPIDLGFDLGTGAFQSSAVTAEDLTGDPELLSDEEGLALAPADAAGFSTTAVTDRGRIDTILRERGTASGVTPMEECYAIGTSTYQSQRAESFVIAQGVVNAKAKVTQGSGTSHSLGVAVNFGGGWKGSGSTSKTTSSSASQGDVATTRRYYNRVKYRYYTNSCGVGYGYRWRPYSIQELVAGYVLVTRITYPNSRCNTYDASYSYEKHQGRNTTYGTGVDLAQVNVSAQSGYNSDTKLSWPDFTGRAKLCWSSTAGREQSARVVAQVP